ncbi:MAG: HNH endonuclease [Cryobacterium sp.]|nr:HNH endonuclease [Oligoflexia bacterium]
MKYAPLFTRIKNLITNERRIGVEILECLHDIEKNRAYSELHYDGLYSFCVHELKFTDAQAYQRIQAMRALREVPEMKPLIESGSLSVSNVAKVHTHFRKEAKEGRRENAAGKRELFFAMENLSSRAADKILAERRGEEPTEKLILELDRELAELWNQAKHLAAHRSRGDASEVLKIMTLEWLERNDPLRAKEKKRKNSAAAKKRQRDQQKDKSDPENLRAVQNPMSRLAESKPQKSESKSTPPDSERVNGVHSKIAQANQSNQDIEVAQMTSLKLPNFRRSVRNAAEKNTLNRTSNRGAQNSLFPDRKQRTEPWTFLISPENRRRPSLQLRREIWKHHEGKCEKCASTYALEIDHIIPYSCGGLTTRDNLRLLCRNCNQSRKLNQNQTVRPLTRNAP